MPDSCPEILINKNGYYIPIGHETLELLDYAGEMCEKSKDYKFDKCRLEFIEKVNYSTGSRLFVSKGPSLYYVRTYGWGVQKMAISPYFM